MKNKNNKKKQEEVAFCKAVHVHVSLKKKILEETKIGLKMKGDPWSGVLLHGHMKGKICSSFLILYVHRNHRAY